MKKYDFRVHYDKGRLAISSETKSEHEDKEGEKVTHREFSYQLFQRAFTAFENVVDAVKIGVNHDNGILHISLSKSKEVNPKPVKQIAIKYFFTGTEIISPFFISFIPVPCSDNDRNMKIPSGNDSFRVLYFCSIQIAML